MNPYDVLEVPRNSSIDVCKKAFRRLAHKYHPDVCNDTDASSKFIRAKKAIDIILGKEKSEDEKLKEPVVYYQSVRVWYCWGGYSNSAGSSTTAGKA